jgi:hypothetical protein
MSGRRETAACGGTLTQRKQQKARSKTIIEPQNVVPPVIHMYWNQYLMLGEQ